MILDLLITPIGVSCGDKFVAKLATVSEKNQNFFSNMAEDEEDEVTDMKLQIFHNTVREHIVSSTRKCLKIFSILVQFLLM